MPFEEQLEMQLGDYVTVFLQGIGDCNKLEGILCSIMDDYIVLIDGDERVEIRLDYITAVRKFAGGASEMY